jgi:hypothetical protein
MKLTHDLIAWSRLRRHESNGALDQTKGASRCD